MSFVQLENVGKEYRAGAVNVRAVHAVNLQIERGEFAMVVGASGAGKTTLLNLLGGVDRASTGRIEVDGSRLEEMRQKELTRYRREDVGFVFQFFNLVQNLNALENVELAAEYCRRPLDARALMESLGLEHRLRNFPSQLSGGEQQRVAIARALVKNPKLLLCDEPTGALDTDTGRMVLGILQLWCQQQGTTCIMITHNTAYEVIANRVIRMRNGEINGISVNHIVQPVEAIRW